MTVTPLSVASKALAAWRAPAQARSITRANELLTAILGDDAGYATDATDAPDGEIWFDLDDMQLRFVEGGTPEDDHYEVTFLSIPHPAGVRTLAGLGFALTAILERLRIQGEYIAAEMPQ